MNVRLSPPSILRKVKHMGMFLGGWVGVKMFVMLWFRVAEILDLGGQNADKP